MRTLFLAIAVLCAAPAHAQISDRDHLLAIMAERDRQYGQRFEAQEKAVQAALAAAALATSKADAASEKRFESVNEFRNTLKDQQTGLATRSEMEARFKFIEDKLNGFEARQSKLQGSTEGQNWLWGLIVGAAGLMLAAIVAYRGRPIVASK